MKSFVYALVALMLAGTVLTACDTMEGAGQDIKHGGQDLSNSANANK